MDILCAYPSSRLLTNMSLSYLEISPCLKAISRADVHTSSYYEVICKAGLSGLINLSSTIFILKLLHRLTIEWYLPLKTRTKTGPSLQL